MSPFPRIIPNPPRQDGSPAALPHWAKWTESYVEGAEEKLKRAYASRLPLLSALSKEWDPNRVFVNGLFQRLLFDDSSSSSSEPKVVVAEEAAAVSS